MEIIFCDTVAMTYDINPYDEVNDEGSQRDNNEHPPPIQPHSDHSQIEHTPPNPTPPDHTPTGNRPAKKRVRIIEGEREAPQTSPAHHYEDLQEMVNATVTGKTVIIDYS